MALVAQSAALMIKEADLDTKFPNMFKELMGSGEQREQLSTNIKELALPGATEQIADVISSLLKN